MKQSFLPNMINFNLNMLLDLAPRLQKIEEKGNNQTIRNMGHSTENWPGLFKKSMSKVRVCSKDNTNK